MLETQMHANLTLPNNTKKVKKNAPSAQELVVTEKEHCQDLCVKSA